MPIFDIIIHNGALVNTIILSEKWSILFFIIFI